MAVNKRSARRNSANSPQRIVLTGQNAGNIKFDTMAQWWRGATDLRPDTGKLAYYGADCGLPAKRGKSKGRYGRIGKV